MDKKINADQLDRLYAFTRAHYVEHYDLQTELADHLANAIEATWQQQPALPFEDALQREFKKFGVFGFSTVVEKSQKALGKKYYKLMWGYFKQFFKLPQIVLTLTMLFVTYKLLELEPMIYFGYTIFISFTVLIKTCLYRREYNEKVKATGKRWLLEDIIYGCGGIVGFISLPFHLFSFSFEGDVSPIKLCVLTAFVVFSALISYIVLFVIPARAQEHLKEAYPEYSL